MIKIENLQDGRQKITHPSRHEVFLSKEHVARMTAKEKADKLIEAAKRQILIDNNPCGFNCPEGALFSCGCDRCAKNDGCFGLTEKEQFSQKDQDLIAPMWGDKTGYLGNGGCRLPRRLRPIKCLEYVCAANKEIKTDG